MAMYSAYLQENVCVQMPCRLPSISQASLVKGNWRRTLRDSYFLESVNKAWLLFYELRTDLTCALCLLVASLCMTLFLVVVTALTRGKTAELISDFRKSDLKDATSDCIIHPLFFTKKIKR